MLIEWLKRVGFQVDTGKLIHTLEGIHDLDMGLGMFLNFGPSEHQASHACDSYFAELCVDTSAARCSAPIGFGLVPTG